MSTKSTEQALLAALTRLMANWSSTGTQVGVAAEADVAVDPIDIAPLYMLGLHGPSRAGDLATALHVTRPTMSKQLARLERAGFIERRADPDDRRAAVVHLSSAGAVAHQRLVARGVTMMREALRGWDGAEAARFADQLARFVTALDDRASSGREPASGAIRPQSRSKNGGES